MAVRPGEGFRAQHTSWKRSNCLTDIRYQHTLAAVQATVCGSNSPLSRSTSRALSNSTAVTQVLNSVNETPTGNVPWPPHSMMSESTVDADITSTLNASWKERILDSEPACWDKVKRISSAPSITREWLRNVREQCSSVVVTRHYIRQDMRR